MSTIRLILIISLAIPLLSCSMQAPPPEPTKQAATVLPEPTNAERPVADVLSVEVSGSPGAYTFSVEIRSPDLGCQQYADWWEVIDADGYLVYRRVLAHSHVNEQPFTRSGGPVEIDVETPLWIRAHMHPAGYGGLVLQGSVLDGFTPAALSPDYASDLETSPPLPGECAF